MPGAHISDRGYDPGQILDTPVGRYGIRIFKKYFGAYFEFDWSLVRVFADPTNTYQEQDLSFKLLKLDQCANAVFGRT